MTKENKSDLNILRNLVQSNTLVEFKKYLSDNGNYVRNLNNGLIDFDFRSLTATINENEETPYISKMIDCWDEFGNWCTSIQLSDKIFFKQ